MTPLALILTNPNGTTTTVPLAKLPSGSYHATTDADDEQFTVYLDLVRQGRSPAKARFQHQ